MVGAGWFAMGFATNLPMLYILYTLSGAGVGIVYGIAINTANRWFPDRRGMASGFTAAGYGLGVLPFLPLITNVIHNPDLGVQAALKITGVIMGGLIILIAFFIRFPGGAKPKKPVPTEKDFKTGEMLRTQTLLALLAVFLLRQLRFPVPGCKLRTIRSFHGNCRQRDGYLRP